MNLVSALSNCLFLLDMNGITCSIILLSALLTCVYRILLIFYKLESDQIYNFYKISVHFMYLSRSSDKLRFR